MSFQLRVLKGKSWESGFPQVSIAYSLQGNLDYSRPDVVKINRAYLYNAALLSRAFERLLSQCRPDHVICFHSLLPYYRTVFEIARYHHVRLLVHERGSIDDSFWFLDNEHFWMFEGQISGCRDWKDIPLNLEECNRVKRYLTDRETGINTNFPPYYRYKTCDDDVRQSLRIPGDAKVVVIFTTSDFELSMAMVDVEMTFESQLEGLRYLIHLFESRKEYLVIRCHPYLIGPTHMDVPVIQELLKISKDLPKNVRFLMPNEKLTAYSIMWNSDWRFYFWEFHQYRSLSKGFVSQ